MSDTSPAARWKSHLARDRDRSADARRAAREAGRPSPHQVAAAITEAMAEVWAAHVDRVAVSREPEDRRRAISRPLGLDLICERAVEILVEHKRCDRTIAAQMVLRRVRPKRILPIRVEKADDPLTTPLTSYR